MKTLQLSIIVLVIITAILSIPTIFRVSSENELSVTVSGLKDTYGVGEPITFFVDITNSNQNTIYPRAVIRNDYTTVWDSGYDLLPNGSKEAASVYYISEYSNNVPMINQTGKYKLIVYYGELATEKDITVVTLNKEDGIIHYYGSYEGIDQETGTTHIADQSYFIKTIHETPSDIIKPSDTKIEFHGVSFTFPGCGSCLPVPTVENPSYNVNVQFPDKTSETLVIRDNMWPTVGPPIDDHQYFSNGTRIFPNGTKGTWTMTQHKDQIVTTLSIHTDPQAAITITHDSIKLLVSTKNQTSSVITNSVPPLKQYESGLATKDVTCKEGLQLVIKSEDGSPACVRSVTAQKLIERGWAKEIVTNTSTESSTLNKTTTNELKIELSNQTYEAGYPVYVNLKNLNQGSDCKIPSISIRDASDQSLMFGPTPARNYTGNCAEPWQITFYAGLEKNALITKSTSYSILATLDNKTYQKEFTVIPSQYSNKNITADSTQIMPGYLTFTSCLPVSDIPNNGTLINYTGFDLYHRYLAGPDTGGIPEIDDYLLKPGHTGSFIMQVHQGQFSNDANLAGGLYFLSENLLNLDNSTVWNNRPLASEAHPGLVLSYTPSFAKAGPEGYATITASISALQNATRGTYWLHLPPGICGGDRVLLTIGEQPLAQPPDYIGYDLASNFGQGVGNPTESDVTFELINAGIHTFENCSLNYVSKNQTTTIKTFDIIPPGIEYKYHANLTSISKVSGFLECKKPPITKVYPDTWIDIIPY